MIYLKGLMGNWDRQVRQHLWQTGKRSGDLFPALGWPRTGTSPNRTQRAGRAAGTHWAAGDAWGGGANTWVGLWRSAWRGPGWHWNGRFLHKYRRPRHLAHQMQTSEQRSSISGPDWLSWRMPVQRGPPSMQDLNVLSIFTFKELKLLVETEAPNSVLQKVFWVFSFFLAVL